MLAATRCVVALLLVTLPAVAAEDVCAPDDPTCSPDEEALSLLQKKATKHASFDLPDFLSPAALISKACKEQCAGTVCQDPKVGINQQLSCMQACEMRMHGEARPSCEAKCDRNGGSGCSLTVNGFTASMCGYCSDWKASTNDQKHSFWDNEDCKQGCRVETPCEQQCENTLCKDPNTGSNQQLSCMQTCEMRMRGENPQQCEDRCDRNGGSGCSLTVKGFTAHMCGACSDWKTSNQEQRQSFFSNDDCRQGCNVGKLSACEKQCAGTVCQDPSQGMNQELSCMQACEMRMHGENEAECGFKCKRNGQSGCSLTASGFTASMCGYCSDWKASSQAQKHSFLNNQDCVKGCSVSLEPEDPELM